MSEHNATTSADVGRERGAGSLRSNGDDPENATDEFKVVLIKETNSVMFCCPTCNKLFNKRANLKIHIRKHTGELPYTCGHEGCGKKFMWKSSATFHEGSCKFVAKEQRNAAPSPSSDGSSKGVKRRVAQNETTAGSQQRPAKRRSSKKAVDKASRRTGGVSAPEASGRSYATASAGWEEPRGGFEQFTPSPLAPTGDGRGGVGRSGGASGKASLRSEAAAESGLQRAHSGREMLRVGGSASMQQRHALPTPLNPPSPGIFREFYNSDAPLAPQREPSLSARQEASANQSRFGVAAAAASRPPARAPPDAVARTPSESGLIDMDLDMNLEEGNGGAAPEYVPPPTGLLTSLLPMSASNQQFRTLPSSRIGFTPGVGGGAGGFSPGLAALGIEGAYNMPPTATSATAAGVGVNSRASGASLLGQSPRGALKSANGLYSTGLFGGAASAGGVGAAGDAALMAQHEPLVPFTPQPMGLLQTSILQSPSAMHSSLPMPRRSGQITSEHVAQHRK
eukprot:CAMPEP_0185844198 /NCGR_PEP_ID=MMETSP1354-20130828/448_1 /TAXON_ID=708628 /ORGANISM="Erythrolobus madagascarensis, Strain CCMP3276" /LENGTH=509 /DNA_ID=CAMNT_0028543819 /DNA_START=366 /DNA_END=1895 /DNA_ORIENTATION=-